MMSDLDRHFRLRNVCIAIAAAAAMAAPAAAQQTEPEGQKAFLAAAAAAAASARSSSETPQEQANKQLVLNFYAALRGGTMQAAQGKYMSPDYKHNSERYLRPRGTQAPPTHRLGPDMVVEIMARGDRVMMLTSREYLNPPAPRATPLIYIFNMFRIKDGKIVEHWDVIPGELGT